MILIPLLKSIAVCTFTLTVAPEISAQVNSWQFQYNPSYYYGYSPSYQHPSYYYTYQAPTPRVTPVPTRTPATAPLPGATAALPPRQSATRSAKPTPVPAKARSARVDTSRWLTDFERAWALAQNQGKPLVVVFTHQGCPECDKMDAALAQSGAASALSSAIKVRVEFTRNPSIVQRYSVSLTPTLLILSPAHNGEVYREVGALTVDRLQLLKPSIDSLVTGSDSTAPREQSQTTLPGNNDLSANSNDDETTRTVAAL